MNSVLEPFHQRLEVREALLELLQPPAIVVRPVGVPEQPQRLRMRSRPLIRPASPERSPRSTPNRY
jgi:hypothetical protein